MTDWQWRWYHGAFGAVSASSWAVVRRMWPAATVPKELKTPPCRSARCGQPVEQFGGSSIIAPRRYSAGWWLGREMTLAGFDYGAIFINFPYRSENDMY